MNKDEILRRSREQKEDEGAVYEKNIGRYYGFIGCSAVFAIIVLVTFFTNQSINAPMSLYCAFIGAESYGKYHSNKKKVELFVFIIGSFASILFLLSYILIDVLKVMVY